MAASSILQLASCKISGGIACSTVSRTGGPRLPTKEVRCALRPSRCALRPSLATSSYALRRVGQRNALQPRRLTCFLSSTTIFTSSSAKAATQTFGPAVAAQVAELTTPDVTSEQILTAQDSLKDVADASQLSLQDVVGDAKERVGEIVEGTQDKAEELVKDLPRPDAGEALQSLVAGTQDRVEDAGDALQNLVEGTQSRIGSAQNAVKAFTERLSSKSSETIQSAPQPASQKPEPLAPAVPDLTEKLSNSSAPAAQSFGESTQQPLQSLQESTPIGMEGAAPGALDGAQDKLGSVGGDRLEDAGGALQDLVEGTRDRLGSAQNAVKAFTERLSSKSAETIQSAPQPLMAEPLAPAVPDLPEKLSNSSVPATEGLTESTQQPLQSLQESTPSVLEGAAPGALHGAQDKLGSAGADQVEDAGDALQDLVEGTRDRLGSAQNAFKAFTERLSSKSAETIQSAPQPAQQTAEPLAPAVPDLPEKLNSSAPATQGLAESTKQPLQSLQESTPSVLEEAAPSALEGAQDKLGSAGGVAQDGGQAVTGTFSSFKESAEESVNAAQDSVSDAMENAGAALGAGKAAVDDVLLDAQETLKSTLSGAASAIQGSLTAAQQAYQISVDSAKNGLLGAVHTVHDAFSGTISSASKAVSGVGSQVDAAVKPLREIGVPIKGAIDQATATVVDSASRVSQEVEAALPPEARNALASAKKAGEELSGPLQGLLKQALDLAGDLVGRAEETAGFKFNDPAVVAVLVGGGVVTLIVTWWIGEKTGYGGDLTPEEALELLQKESRALLVDVRPQKLRDEYGIPALKRGARFKQASVDPVELDNDVRRLVRDATSVEYQILAAQIKGLKNVGSGTTVVVMDDRGQIARDVARAVARTGIKKAYVLEGGYSAWAASQETREDVPEAPVVILAEEAAFLEQDTGVPAPVLAAGITAGVVLGGRALLEWEKTLQLIGVLGIAYSIYWRVQSYSSMEEVKADIRLLQRPIQAGTGIILSLFGQVDKVVGSPKLVTLPRASVESAARQQAPDDDEYDDPVEEEEEEQTKEAPGPTKGPVSKVSADQT